MKSVLSIFLLVSLLGFTGLFGEDKILKPEVEAVSSERAMILLAEDKPPLVIDLRTEGEFQSGHIPGAKMIDFKSAMFRETLSQLDRNQAYLFHCKSGGRSAKSLKVWKELGFTKLYHLDSGILGWKKADGVVVQE